jgi:hypothetical protein
MLRIMPWISYVYYQQIEMGKRIPPLVHLLKISKALELDDRTICFEFARAMMPDTKSASYFDRNSMPAPSSNQSMGKVLINNEEAFKNWTPSKVLNVSDRVLAFFSEHLGAYEVYVALSTTTARSAGGLSEVLNQPVKVINETLKELTAINHISIKDGIISLNKSAIQIHGNADNHHLLWKLFRRHNSRLHANFYSNQRTTPAFRDSTCIALEDSQAEAFVKDLEALARKYYSLEKTPGKKTRPYSLSMLFGQRFSSKSPTATRASK